MDTNKILSADLLDLVFDNRNKAYGAYELRRSYHSRILKALFISAIIVAVTYAGVVIAGKSKLSTDGSLKITSVDLIAIPPEQPVPEVIPVPKPTTPQVQTLTFVPPVIVPDDQASEPPPTVDDFKDSRIDNFTQDGAIADGTVSLPTEDVSKDIIAPPVIKEPEIATTVQVDAVFDGNWEKFLTRNLDPQTPINHDAPPGNYTVLVQFVVDLDGSISDVKALTRVGYGLEEEAVRVIKRSNKWRPAINDGRQVKAYRRQSIVFQVPEE